MRLKTNQYCLLREIFIVLHDEVVEKFELKCNNENIDPEEIDKYQKYGYGKFNLKDKLSITRDIRENERVRAFFQGNGEEKDPKNNLKNLYAGDYLNKRRTFAKKDHVIYLSGIYKKVFFLYLGYEDLDDFLKKSPKLIANKDLVDQQRALIEGIKDPDKVSPNTVVYDCLYYSKWRGYVYRQELTINFTEGLIQNSTGKAYPIKAKDKFKRDIKDVEKYYKGDAILKNNRLYVYLTTEDNTEFLDLNIIVGVPPIQDIKMQNLFMGAYVGNSRSGEIICGEVFLLKQRQGKDYKKLLKHLRELLKMQQHQFRISGSPFSIEKVKELTHNLGTELVNEHKGEYRLFTINGELKLVEFGIKIKSNFVCEIQANNHGIVEKYEGRIVVVRNKICLLEIRTKNDFYTRDISSVYFDSDLDNYKAIKYHSGSFLLIHTDAIIHQGKCLLIKGKSKYQGVYEEKNNLDKDAELIYQLFRHPQRHKKPRLSFS